MHPRRRAIATLVAAVSGLLLAACAAGSGAPPATSFGFQSGTPTAGGTPAPAPSPVSGGATPTTSAPGGATPTKPHGGGATHNGGTSTASAPGSPSAPTETGDYSVSIAHPQGFKVCTWRLAPEHNGIAIGFGVLLGHTGPEVTTAPVQVTLTIVEAARSITYSYTVDNSEIRTATLEIPGFAPGTSAYHVTLVVTIIPPGPDLNAADNTETASANVPVGTPTSTGWTTIPCT